ncbi:Rrp15p-domain-containing protein [Trichoderma citrinoviride]|uniref:Rrp15p-domain-containing protein n=1 Tax=Trichoderma citrinoviride TaxID=58853 RepID=A0A2T4BJY3_9HYPO|nr:Rrp15p-domain-containing protein [Trichoderma citrinoviride]PTB69632.1 Rrp15p-domain-containing protein [Trichoderma citrinoviride]
MGGMTNKKRRHDNKSHRPSKKQRKAQAYNSDSEPEEEQQQQQQQQAFDPVNLLDSDDDIHNAPADDGAGADEDASSSSDEEGPVETKKNKAVAKKSKSKKSETEPEAAQQEDDDDEEEEEEEEEEGGESDDDDDELDLGVDAPKKKSKRNDPTAFATSLSKILSTKLSASKRSDPVLSRSAAAHEASKAAVDIALEAKARRKLKEQKRVALEKGRVKDVLVASVDESGEPEMTTAEILAIEKTLRKTAQRGVIRMFNAVRAAQVQAAEAEKAARKEGIIGAKTREEKVNEMSKKGFLDLIASGGGGLKKTPLEEA